jgi:hypothetical protein
VVAPAVGQAAADWILTVQSPFVGGEAAIDVPCSAFDRFGSSLFIGVPKPDLFCVYPMGSDGLWGSTATAGPGRNPCVKLTMATPAGVVTFLEASSWR